MFKVMENEFNSHKKILEDCINNLQNHIYTASIIVNETLKNGNKIYIFGNGANAIIAQYIAFQLNQKNSNFIATTLNNNSPMFSLSLNYEDKIFENQIKDIVNDGDLLIGISTSGNSKNVLRGLSTGRTLGCKTMGLSGYDGGAMNEFCDINLVVPCDDTSRIKEMYITIGHIICQMIDDF